LFWGFAPLTFVGFTVLLFVKCSICMHYSGVARDPPGPDRRIAARMTRVGQAAPRGLSI
jgi:hypothetical protein